jgi:hypothetical protein
MRKVGRLVLVNQTHTLQCTRAYLLLLLRLRNSMFLVGNAIPLSQSSNPTYKMMFRSDPIKHIL